MPDVSIPVGSGGQGLQTPDLNFASGTIVTLGAASAQSAAINSRVVLLSANQNCWITASANPTAAKAAGSLYLAAGQILFMAITPNWKIAGLQDSAAGSLCVIPCVYPN
jgi:hypothetical protein